VNNKKNNLLRINIGFLINQTVGTNREFTYNLPELIVDDEEDLKFTDVVGSTLISRAQQGLLIQGDFSAVISSTCVRCLTDFNLPLQTSFSELYAFKEDYTTESGLLVPDNGYIDLKPLLTEYLLVEIPIKPICTENCAGLCPICGCNLNTTNCEHDGQESQDEPTLRNLSL
jgi:uncharacterized protein